MHCSEQTRGKEPLLSNYELTYILRPLEEANLTATTEKINTIVRNAGGEIVARNDWGRRRLAFPIRKIPDGYYSTLFITLPGTAVRGVERALQLNDDVLRYLVVRVQEFRLPPAPPAEVPVVPAEVPGTTPPSASPEAPPAAEPVAEATTDTAPAVTAEGS
jgi:small subunit ribosomal protein S6